MEKRAPAAVAQMQPALPRRPGDRKRQRDAWRRMKDQPQPAGAPMAAWVAGRLELAGEMSQPGRHPGTAPPGTGGWAAITQPPTQLPPSQRPLRVVVWGSPWPVASQEAVRSWGSAGQRSGRFDAGIVILSQDRSIELTTALSFQAERLSELVAMAKVYLDFLALQIADRRLRKTKSSSQPRLADLPLFPPALHQRSSCGI